MGIHIVAKFGADWSNMANFLIQGQITWTVLVQLVP